MLYRICIFSQTLLIPLVAKCQQMRRAWFRALDIPVSGYMPNKQEMPGQTCILAMVKFQILQIFMNETISNGIFLENIQAKLTKI